MTVCRPTLGQLKSVAESLSFNLSDEDLRFFMEEMQPALDLYDLVEALPDNLPAVKYPRAPGIRPTAGEDPLNAWYLKTEIKGASGGKLAGKTVAIKDNVAVSGVQ
ncbi:amidase, partial [Rhizobium ruizarguesonis]